MVPVAWVCAAFAYHNAIPAKTGAIIDGFGNARQLFRDAQQKQEPDDKNRYLVRHNRLFSDQTAGKRSQNNKRLMRFIRAGRVVTSAVA